MENRQGGRRIAQHFEELFVVIVRVLGRPQGVSDPESFRSQVREALRRAEQAAGQDGYSSEDVRAAVLAVVAFLDESLRISSNFSSFQASASFQEELYGGHMAGEAFFKMLDQSLSKPDSAALGDVLEVYYLSLLLGYKGRYAMSEPGALQLVQLNVQRRVLAIRGVPCLSRGPTSSLDWQSLARPRWLWRKWAFAGPSGAELNAVLQQLERLRAEAESRLATAPNPESLSKRPVIFIIGDSGSGKTSVVVESGLEPILLAGSLRTGAPSAPANIWLARGAILLEIGGAASGSPGIWRHLGKVFSHSLLNVVIRARPQPRAVAWCLDSRLLLPGADPDMFYQAVKRGRKYLSEISAALNRTVPVYAIFTKLDSLPSFCEYVMPMDPLQRQSFLGVTLPVSALRSSEAAIGSDLSTAVEALDSFLRDQRIVLLGRESRIQQRRRLFEFPREFAKLSEKLAEFGRLMDLDSSRSGLALRGLYFTGRSVETERATSFSVQPSAQFDAPSGATRIFRDADSWTASKIVSMEASPNRPNHVFVSGLFRDVLLKDLAETR